MFFIIFHDSEGNERPINAEFESKECAEGFASYIVRFGEGPDAGYTVVDRKEYLTHYATT